jgi:hypothetical protein
VTEACADGRHRGRHHPRRPVEVPVGGQGRRLKTDYSIHLWFDQAINAFRFILRMNGQPWLSAAIARKNGSNTLSHFVTCRPAEPAGGGPRQPAP